MAHFNPWGNPKPCRHCTHYGHPVSGGVYCLRANLVNAEGTGCVFFEREPGADDDLPAGTSGIGGVTR